ncbi:uncharacterized protein LOC110862054 isoform X2 [Folsomia candida]|uniref:uncharacterized protein LOC110862054 isoform X2 n=1 Tax=Folsomia candida TaxID=158441 RepID=UPI001604EC9D|nr:uncharacterized protein LOC110862054 isoform X2 [Folsomia candida]
MLPSSNETIKEQLDAMPMEDFEDLLKQAYQNQEPVSEHAEILKQLKGTLDAHGDSSTLSNAKYHSSLQSLNNNEASTHPHPTPAHLHKNNNHHHVPTKQQETKTLHHYSYGYNHHYGHLNHTSTLTTINSTSSLNSLGVDGEGGGGGGSSSSLSLQQQKQQHLAYFFNDRDDDRAPATGSQRSYNRSSGSGQIAPKPSIDGTEMTSTWENAASALCSDQPFELSGPTYYPGAPGTTSLSPDAGRSLTPSLPLPGSIKDANKEGTNDRRRLNDRLAKKKSSKNNVKERNIEVIAIPGYRGNEKDVDDLVHFVLGDDAPSNKKNKKDQSGAKTKDTLVKSASLDENHLNARKRSSSSSTERPSSKSLKEIEKKSERAVSSHQISSSPPPGQSPVSLPPNCATSAPSKKITVNQKSSNKNSKEENVISVPTVPKKEAPQSKRTVKEDDSTEHPFELVTKKKKTKKTMTQREAESFSRRQAKEASRREQARARRVGGGERRTSVCSAPESENSDQSDDDSVRSLPAGECTPREHIPKQCASSGGTPQTSYADIAKAPEPANSNQFSPSPTTGASDHPINFPSRKTVPFSPPSNKGGGEALSSTKDVPTPDSKDCPIEREPFKSSGMGSTVPNSTKTFKPNSAIQQPVPGSKLPPLAPKIVNINNVGQAPSTNQTQRSNVPPVRNNRNQYQNNKNQLILQTMPQPERPYLSTVIKTHTSSSQQDPSCQPHPAKGKEEVKVLIEDTNEFPDICSSMSSLSMKPPFSKKTAHNHNGPSSGNPTFVTNMNNNNNNNINDNGSMNKVQVAAKTPTHAIETKNDPHQTPTNTATSPRMSEKPMSTPPRHIGETVLSLITTEKSPIVEEIVRVVQPVFVPEVPNQQTTTAGPITSPSASEEAEVVIAPSGELTLVNGDHEQDIDPEELMEGRSRNSASVSSSVGGGEAVVFCRGNIESEIPNQDVGFEFGFNVMEHTTYLPWPPQPMVMAEGEGEDIACEGSTPPFSPEESYQTSTGNPEQQHCPPSTDDEYIEGSSAPTTSTRWSEEQQQQQHSYDPKSHPGSRYPHSNSRGGGGGPPPSLLGSYRGPSADSGNPRPRGSYAARRGGGFGTRGSRGNPGGGGDRNSQQQAGVAQIQVQQQQQQPPPQFTMPIPLPPLSAPQQLAHFGANPQQIPPHMLSHYGLMAAAAAHHQSQAQQVYPIQSQQRVPLSHPQHYLPQPPMVGMNIYAYQPPPPPHTIPVTSSPAMLEDPNSIHQMQQQQQQHQMTIPITTGATSNMTMVTQPSYVPIMMSHPHEYISMQPLPQPQPQLPPPPPPAQSLPPVPPTVTQPYIGQVHYTEAGAMVMPAGVVNPSFLFYTPPNYTVPDVSGEVEPWLDGYFDEKLRMGAAGLLTLHRIE